MLTALLASPALHAGYPGWGWPGPWLFLLIPFFWILIFVIIFAIFGRRWRGYGPHGPGGWGGSMSAEQTLSERYARGDIDETEYRARLEVLRANRPTG